MMGKLEIATKLCYRAPDVMALTGYGRTKVYEIMAECRKSYGGAIPMLPDAIKPESLMAYFGTTMRDYISALKESE